MRDYSLLFFSLLALASSAGLAESSAPSRAPSATLESYYRRQAHEFSNEVLAQQVNQPAWSWIVRPSHIIGEIETRMQDPAQRLELASFLAADMLVRGAGSYGEEVLLTLLKAEPSPVKRAPEAKLAPLLLLAREYNDMDHPELALLLEDLAGLAAPGLPTPALLRLALMPKLQAPSLLGLAAELLKRPNVSPADYHRLASALGRLRSPFSDERRLSQELREQALRKAGGGEAALPARQG